MKNDYVIINNPETLNIKKMNINEENLVVLDFNKIICDLYKSFNNSKKEIYKQFKNDFHRCHYIINNSREENINIFINYFEFALYKYNIKPYIIFMLCNQAIMGIALQLLYKNINKNRNIYIGELKTSTNLKFIFISNNDNLYLKISKILRIFKINKNNEDITLRHISINIFISLSEKDKIIIIYKILRN